MKKIFYLASIAALALSSCAKDDTTEVTLGSVASGGKITAAMSDNDTRTYLDANQTFRWEGTDAIAVYNNNTAARMNGTQFKMTEGDKSTVAVFNGPALNSKFNHLAVYPWTQEKLFLDVNWKKIQKPGAATGTYVTLPEFDDNISTEKATVKTIMAKIPATQEYYPGTFGNGVVPAITSRFDIAADGSADVSMQPLADYVFVDIQAVEAIKSVSLQLRNGTDPWLDIAGEGLLDAYLLDGAIRYYLPAENLTQNPADKITIVTNERAPEVSCHEANTFVFVVPGGILGMGKDAKVEAELVITGVSGETYTINAVDPSRVTTSVEKGVKDRIVNTHLNYKLVDPKKPYSDTNSIYRKNDETPEKYQNQTIPAKTMRMENGYFYLNTKNAKGEVVPFVFNPAKTYIIEHEGHLLKYLTEYGTAGFNGSTDGYVDALICATHKFDFSEKHITELSDLKDANNQRVYAEFEEYFAAYLGKGGTFPTITADRGFVNSFNGVEYTGNMPEITGIYQPLRNVTGIFGDINEGGKVSNVTFSNVIAGSELDDDLTYLLQNYVYTDGLILGSMNGGSISNITVKNAQGLAILGKANNAAYNALTIDNAKGLDFIALDMDLTGDLEIKNYSAASAVAYDVFGTLDATKLVNGDYHHVVKLPAGADYSKLVAYVGTGNTFATDNMIPASGVFGKLTLEQHAALGMAYAKAVPADQTDENVVSVLIGDATSVWTGDKFYGDYWQNDKVKVGTYAKDSDVVNGYKVKGYYKLEYAEQLATGATSEWSAVVMRNMDLSYAVNKWAMVTVDHLEGNNKVVKGVKMRHTGVTEPTTAPAADYLDSAVAPVDAYRVTNLTVDGVTIDIFTETGKVVPCNIAGLAWRAEDVQNVTVKNLVITGDGVNKNNEEYADEQPVFIGWLVANTRNPYIINSKVEGVDSAISGIAGLIGKITMTTNTNDKDHSGVRVENSYATVTKKAQTDLADFKEAINVNWNKESSAGTTVGYINNSEGSDVTVTLKGNGTPVFIYYAPQKINVSYSGTKIDKTLVNNPSTASLYESNPAY